MRRKAKLLSTSNEAMVGTSTGSSKNFEAFFKSLEVSEKKVKCPNLVCACSANKIQVYDNQAKMAVSVALFMIVLPSNLYRRKR
jgi:hypothetical protein